VTSSRSEEEIRLALRAFVRDASEGKVSEVTDTTPLFGKEGALKSVHVLELILLLEELTARPVDVQSLKPGAFIDIEAIVSGFVRSSEFV